jgi:hypothetical protein
MTDVRPIDAEAMKSYIDCGHLRPPTEKCFSELDVVRMLDKQPTLDYAPVVHAAWLKERSGIRRCSYCDKGYRITNGGPNVMTFSYCPNCGAKMDMEKEDTRNGETGYKRRAHWFLVPGDLKHVLVGKKYRWICSGCGAGIDTEELRPPTEQRCYICGALMDGGGSDG